MRCRSFSLIFACLLSFFFSQSVIACSACFLAKKENLMAFFATGILLSLLPFILIGGVGFWLYRQAKKDRDVSSFLQANLTGPFSQLLPLLLLAQERTRPVRHQVYTKALPKCGCRQ
jgi:hypothetical protein